MIFMQIYRLLFANGLHAIWAFILVGRFLNQANESKCRHPEALTKRVITTTVTRLPHYRVLLSSRLSQRPAIQAEALLGFFSVSAGECWDPLTIGPERFFVHSAPIGMIMILSLHNLKWQKIYSATKISTLLHKLYLRHKYPEVTTVISFWMEECCSCFNSQVHFLFKVLVILSVYEYVGAQFHAATRHIGLALRLNDNFKFSTRERDCACHLCKIFLKVN
jgi:hypothetical protein